jgi:diguanylate cyclase (GGDEF)-like protein
LLVIDVDEFKHVNDTYGHSQGDVVLKTVAETLRVHVGESGVIADTPATSSWLPACRRQSVNQAREVGVRLGAAVRATQIPLRDRAGSVSVTLSIGAALAEAEHREFDGLFAAADRALYEAKRRGPRHGRLGGRHATRRARSAAQHSPVRRPKGRDAETGQALRVDTGIRSGCRRAFR